MDDTTWIVPNKSNLEQILNIADEFYTMTNTAINKDKSELITNAKHLPQPLTLKFGNNNIQINKATNPVRFLGVWIKLSQSKKHTIDQTRQDIKKFVYTIKRKPLTDKQLIYITNMVLVSLIIYRLQNTVLLETEAISLMAPIRKAIKNKLKFTSTAPNSMMYRKYFYNLADLWSIQLQRHFTSLISLFSTKSILFNISKICLFQL